MAAATAITARPPTPARSDETSPRTRARSTTSPANHASTAERRWSAASLAVSAAASGEPKAYDYGLWGVLPVGPYKAKRSAPIETIVPGQVWTIDQKFGILNVQVL